MFLNRISNWILCIFASSLSCGFALAHFYLRCLVLSMLINNFLRGYNMSFSLNIKSLFSFFFMSSFLLRSLIYMVQLQGRILEPTFYISFESSFANLCIWKKVQVQQFNWISKMCSQNNRMPSVWMLPLNRHISPLDIQLQYASILD